MGIPAPDLIKIDCEGNEAAVLVGGMNILRAGIAAVWVETHGSSAHEECRDILSSARYHVFDELRIGPSGHGRLLASPSRSGGSAA